MNDDDPYRSSGLHGTCPRCNNLMDGDDAGGLACPAGCGEMVSRERLGAHWTDVARGRVDTSWPHWPAPCPICQRDMHVAFRDELRFDRCDSHGVWLDAGEHERFFELLGVHPRQPRAAVPQAAVDHLLRVLDYAATTDAGRAIARAVRDTPELVSAVTLLTRFDTALGADVHFLEIVAGIERFVLPVGDWNPHVDTLRARCPNATFHVASGGRQP